ncbi:MAG: DUF1425 domain-containing protein [Phycisphaera sp.]|nr:DUF1425 domain-containing protein [Phycisphaera sp.]
MMTLALAAAMAGCSTDPIEAKWDNVQAYPRISLSQKSLEKALGFQQPTVTRTNNDLMRVSVPIRARSNNELFIEYRVLLFDEAGQPITPATGWIPVRLEPRQPQYIQFTASSPRAKDYNMQVRWSRP